MNTINIHDASKEQFEDLAFLADYFAASNNLPDGGRGTVRLIKFEEDNDAESFRNVKITIGGTTINIFGQ